MVVRHDSSMRETVVRGMMISWVQGFVSGALFAMDRSSESLAVRPPGGEAIAQWLTNYCESHPLLDLDDATRVLLKEIVGPK